MTDTLWIAPEVAQAVLDHALQDAPLECCGVLLGPREGVATRVLAARNVHEEPRTRYQIDPDTLFKATELAENEPGVEVVGFYHSHPRGAAAFSETDRAWGSWQGLSYLLVSLSPLTFLAGRWEGEDFQPLEVRTGRENR